MRGEEGNTVKALPRQNLWHHNTCPKNNLNSTLDCNCGFDEACNPPSEAQQKIKEIGTGVVDLLLRKNKDYGSSVFESPILFPDLKAKDCILIRMSDKIKRFSNLVTSNKSPEVNESIEDTMKDLAGYAILWLVANSMETESAVSRD